MDLNIFLLFGAGFLGGAINSIAGGGSFVTFPALLFSGLPPLIANATNTFSSCGGYMSGAFAFRKELSSRKSILPRYIFLSLLGGVFGALLLISTPKTVLNGLVPWLLLCASLLFAFGQKLNIFFKRAASENNSTPRSAAAMLAIVLFIIATYGGFFNAGLGILILGYLVLSGFSNIHLMNALKLLIMSVVSIVAVIIFIYKGAIAWQEGLFVLAGNFVGGYLSAKISRHIPAQYVRTLVIVMSFGVTLYFFANTY